MPEDMFIMSHKPIHFHNLVVFLLIFPLLINASQKRCFQCRSRTELGDCKDPFTFNATTAAIDENQHGVRAIQCASGWCGKIVEGLGRYKLDDYGVATERFCLQRSPSDGEGRCAQTEWHHRKVFMCYCQGDLCNAATKSSGAYILLTSVMSIFMVWRNC